MFLFNAPILTIISILASALFYALIISAQKIEIIRKICLSASFGALVVGVLAGLSFDKAAAGFQFLASFSYVAEYNSSFAIGVDGLSYIFLLLTLVTFPFLFLAAWTVSKFPKHFFCHLLAMELLLVLTFVTVDLFYFFILFESLLIPMFILIGVWGARTRKIKAAYYFFLYTLFGSLFMLFGMIYLYQITGSLNYHVLLTEQLDINTQKLLWLCFFLAFAVKMPLFPFHIWLPEAHVEAPTVGSMLLASLLLKLGGYGLLRFSLTFLGQASVVYTPVVATLAIAGVIYGSLSTMRQIDLKRIIAYSSVAHMNLVALGIFSFNRVGIEGSIYLMVAHGVVSAALFFCVGVVYDRTHTRLLRYYGGLVTVMPIFAAFFFIFNLANMGFPGTPNFVGELLMLAGIFILSPAILYFSAWGIVFSAAYSTTLFAKTMFGTLKTRFITQFVDVNRREVVILSAFALFSLALGVRSDFLLAYTESAVWNIADFNTAAAIPEAKLRVETPIVSFFFAGRNASTATTRKSAPSSLSRYSRVKRLAFCVSNFVSWLLTSLAMFLFWFFLIPFLPLRHIFSYLADFFGLLFTHLANFIEWLPITLANFSKWCSVARAEFSEWLPIAQAEFFNWLLIALAELFNSLLIAQVEFSGWLDTHLTTLFNDITMLMPAAVLVISLINFLLLWGDSRSRYWRYFGVLVQMTNLFVFALLVHILPTIIANDKPCRWDPAKGILNDIFVNYFVLEIDPWRCLVLIVIFLPALLDTWGAWEEFSTKPQPARLISYLVLRTFFLTLAGISSTTVGLVIASCGLSLVFYRIMCFWAGVQYSLRFARAVLMANLTADLLLFMGVYLLYDIFDSVLIQTILVRGDEMFKAEGSFYAWSVSSTFLIAWLISKLTVFAFCIVVLGPLCGRPIATTFTGIQLALLFGIFFISNFLLLVLLGFPTYHCLLAPIFIMIFLGVARHLDEMQLPGAFRYYLK